jgi:hypothetical protein
MSFLSDTQPSSFGLVRDTIGNKTPTHRTHRTHPVRAVHFATYYFLKDIPANDNQLYPASRQTYTPAHSPYIHTLTSKFRQKCTYQAHVCFFGEGRLHSHARMNMHRHTYACTCMHTYSVHMRILSLTSAGCNTHTPNSSSAHAASTHASSCMLLFLTLCAYGASSCMLLSSRFIPV